MCEEIRNLEQSDDGTGADEMNRYRFYAGRERLDALIGYHQEVIRALGYVGEFLETCDRKIADKNLSERLNAFVAEKMSDSSVFISCQFRYGLLTMGLKKPAVTCVPAYATTEHRCFDFRGEAIAADSKGKKRIVSEGCRKAVAGFVEQFETKNDEYKAVIGHEKEIVEDFKRVQEVIDDLGEKYRDKRAILEAYGFFLHEDFTVFM